MFYSKELLAQKDAVFFVIWQYATNNGQKVDKRDVVNQNVSYLCDTISKMIPVRAKIKDCSKRLSLYLVAQLLYGSVLVFKKQLEYLEKDGERLSEMIRKNNFVFRKAKEYEKQEKSNKKRSRSMLEELEDENLLDLDRISDERMINANINDITLSDVLPWKNQLIEDDFPLYGVLDFEKSNDTHKIIQTFTTFIDGHSSDNSDKNENRPVFANVTPIQEKSGILQEMSCFDVPLEQQMPFENISNDLSLLHPSQQNIEEKTNITDWVEPIPIADPFPVSQSVQEENTKFDLPTQNAIEFNEEIIGQKEMGEPPSKKRPSTFGEVRDSSDIRPITPVDKSTLRSTNTTPAKKTNNQSLEMDSSLFEEPKQKLSRRKKLKEVLIDYETQIDKDEMRSMRNDYSSLIRKKEQIMVKIRKNNELTLDELLDPSPFYCLKKRFPECLKSLYCTGVYENIGSRVKEDDEESSIDENRKEAEETLVFAEARLLPSPYKTIDFENQILLDEIIEEPIPIQPPPSLEDKSFKIGQNLPPEYFDMNENVKVIEEVDIESEGMERARRLTQRSSLGIIPKNVEELYGTSEIKASLESEKNNKVYMEKSDDEEIVFSSGSLYDTRHKIREELLEKICEQRSEWINFNELTTKMSRKGAASAFDIVLSLLKDQKIEAKQETSFDTIYLKKLKNS